MREFLPPPSVVVGIDGSRAAVGAALWAVDEAVSRDIPLRIVYAIAPRGTGARYPDDAARQLATADIAVRDAFVAVEATNKPVRIEVEIAQGRPISALVRASRSAAMVCVGAVGYQERMPGRVGSTASALATLAHCPVAIIRQPASAASAGPRSVIVEADDRPDNGVVLREAIAEARLRSARLQAISCWQSITSEVDEENTVADRNRRVWAQLDRRLARWRRRYPDLETESVAVHGSMQSFLAEKGRSVKLIALNGKDPRTMEELIGPAGCAAISHTDCSLLVVNRRHP
jgi:nucleotide-binding universal stress UspA family protein